MKTEIISLCGLAASEVLQKLNDANIPFKYIGSDQAGKTLWQISHETKDSVLIQSVFKCIRNCDSLNVLLNIATQKVVETVFEERNTQRNKRLTELKNKPGQYPGAPKF